MLAARKSKLAEMGVPWSVELWDGRQVVAFRHPTPHPVFGDARVAGFVPEDGDLCRALGVVLEIVEKYRRAAR